MDASHFDALTRALSAGDSRRRLLARITTLPLLGGLAAILDPDDAEGAGRRKRRVKKHKHGRGRRRKDKRTKKCKPQPINETCSGKCGSVTNNCQQPVNCGSCDCSPACGACFTCQGAAGAPGTCVQQEAGTPCGAPGQVCQADGSCTCDGSSCPDCTTCGGDGLCAACSDCCDGSGVCQAGTTNAACGSSGTCDVCTGQEICQGQTCVCVPDCAGKCGGAADGCGGSCQGTCPTCQTCSAGTCVAAANTTSCNFTNFEQPAIGQCENGVCTCKPPGGSCNCDSAPSYAGCCSGGCNCIPGTCS